MLDHGLLRRLGELQPGLIERDVDDRGRSVIGNEPDGVREGEEFGAVVELRLLRGDLRETVGHLGLLLFEGAALLVELRLLRVEGVELRLLLCGREGCGFELRAGRVELLLTGVQLRGARVELLLAGLGLRARIGELPAAVDHLLALIVELLLGRERIGDAGDVGEVARRVDERGDGALLVGRQSRAVRRAEHHRSGSAAEVRELVLKFRDDVAGCRAGDVEA